MIFLQEDNLQLPIIFFAEKIHVHHWPLSSPSWDKKTTETVDLKLNKNLERKKVIIENHKIKINEFIFEEIKKVGITIPLFKNQTTLVFEGKFENFYAHIHITVLSQNFLEIFNKLMRWKNRFFSNS